MTLLDLFDEVVDPDFLLSADDDEAVESNWQQTEAERQQAEIALERLRARLQALAIEFDEPDGQ